MTARLRAAAGRRLHRLAEDDSGASLIIVLLLVTVVALIIGATLSLTDTSIRATIAVRGQAANSYAAQGAVDAAINTLRTGSYDNDVTSPTYPNCFGSGAGSDTLVLPNFYTSGTGVASSAAVTCSPDPNTGAGGPQVPINSDNKPGNAILTLGTNASEDGLNVKPLSNTIPFVVHGGVVSDSNIRVSNGTLQSNTTVTAHTGCSGTIVATPAAVCNAGTVADPNYPSDAASVPTYQPVPAVAAASCPGKLVTFQPGYYDDAAALNALMNGVGSNPCKGSVWWFKKGTYYFDFHNSSNPLLSGNDVWNVADGQLIAGVPTDASGAVLTTPTVPSTVPGACQSPINATDTDGQRGVQFIFGGDSQLQLSGTADAEICGNYHLHQLPIAVYGLKSGTESPVASSARLLTAVPTADAAWAGTATVSNLANLDASSASWNKTTAGAQTGSFTVTGFTTAASPVPAGSVLNSATLTVRYQNTAGVSGDARSVLLTPLKADGTAGSPITVNLPSTSGAGIQTANVDLYGGGTGLLATALHSYGYAGATAAYSVKVNHTGIEKVDTVQLSLGYTPPALRGETTTAVPGNCLASTYTGSTGGGCAMLTTSVGPNYKGRFYVQGTTYVPNAVVDLTLNNVTAQVLRFGVISRSLWVKETGSINYSGPVIEIPDNSTTYGPGGTVVYLNAYVCEAAATCSTATGKLGLRARVVIYDPSGSPNPPARQVLVQSWAMQR